MGNGDTPPGRTRKTGDNVQQRKRKVRLANARDVRRELATVYRQYANGELNATEARTRSAMLWHMRAAIETDEMERQLEELERSRKDGSWD